MKPAHLVVGVLSSLIVAVAAYQFPAQSDLRDALKEPSLENVNVGEILKLDSNSSTNIRGKSIQGSERKNAGGKEHVIDVVCPSYALQGSLNVKESRIVIPHSMCNALLLTDMPPGTKDYKLVAFMKEVRVTACPEGQTYPVHPSIHSEYVTLEIFNQCGGLVLETKSGQGFAETISKTLGADRKMFLVSTSIFLKKNMPNLGKDWQGNPIEQSIGQ
jgi:hypothetical protein